MILSYMEENLESEAYLEAYSFQRRAALEPELELGCLIASFENQISVSILRDMVSFTVSYIWQQERQLVL